MIKWPKYKGMMTYSFDQGGYVYTIYKRNDLFLLWLFAIVLDTLGIVLLSRFIFNLFTEECFALWVLICILYILVSPLFRLIKSPWTKLKTFNSESDAMDYLTGILTKEQLEKETNERFL